MKQKELDIEEEENQESAGPQKPKDLGVSKGGGDQQDPAAERWAQYDLSVGNDSQVLE